MRTVLFSVIESDKLQELETIPMYSNTLQLQKGTKVLLERQLYETDGVVKVILCGDFFVVVDMFYNPNDDSMCYVVCHEDDTDSLAKYKLI